MRSELYWLTLTCLMTALMWVPYVLNRIAVRGLMPALGYEGPDSKPHSPWAARAMSAHKNAVENIGVFAALVLTAHALGISGGATATAAAVFFVARLVHYVVYVAAVPVVRTLAFAVSWVCMIVFALAILGL